MTPMPDPAEALHQLWERGEPPSLTAFVRDIGPLTLAQLAAVVREDQRQRWQTADPLATVAPALGESVAEPVWVEAYFQQFPQLRHDAETTVDLIFNEFLVRDKLGQRPAAAEYLRRFPEHVAVLKDQIDLHRALSATNAAAQTMLTSSAPTRTPLAEIPEVFGRYRIEQLLGQGGMGSVYLAHDTQLQRRVALKVPRSLGDSRELIDRFYREARIAATFHHPHLCPVYDVGEIDGIHYLTMPYLEGESMAAWLKRSGPLAVPRACRMVGLIARGMQIAHQAGVLHRDLKPANIMLPSTSATTDPEPVVMDFGLARRERASDPQLTGRGVMVGTGAYMPPEQILGETAHVGPASDVYSLGVILYEMLTGRTPFQGALHEVLRDVLDDEPPPPPRLFRPDLPVALDAICLKALAKDPARRFASMADFAAALEPFRSDAALPPSDLQSKPVASSASGKAVVALVTVASLGMLLLGVWFWPLLTTKSDPPKPDEPIIRADDKPSEKKEDIKKQEPKKIAGTQDAAKKIENKKPAKTEQHFVFKEHTGPVRAVAFNPKDPRQFASGSDDGVVRIWRIGNDKPRILKGNPGPVLALAFHPDGERLASAGGDIKTLVFDVLLWNIAETSVTNRFKGHFFLVSGLAFDRAGKRLASSAGDNTMRIWQLDNPNDDAKRLDDTREVNAVAFHPRENVVAVGTDDEAVRRWDLATGKKSLLKGHERAIRAVAFSPSGRYIASASNDSSVILWDTLMSKSPATLRGHEGPVHAIAYNHDGTLLASAGADGTLRLWNIPAGTQRDILKGHDGDIFAVAFSPDGRSIATGGKDQKVILWNVGGE